MIRQSILKILPDLKGVQETPLLDSSGRPVGWHSNVVVAGDRLLGSGTHSDRAISRTIALSEAMERRIVGREKAGERAKNLLLDEYPTTCGFAVGLERGPTRARAIAEGVERWLRSQWIDNHFEIPELPEETVLPCLGPLALRMRADFEAVRYFQTSNSIDLSGETIEALSTIVVGLKGEGAFVGSRTAWRSTDPWTHALVEAWRHLLIFERSQDREHPDIRSAVYFGEHREEAVRQIARAERKDFPRPRLRIIEEVDTQAEGVFCFRALCHEFQGWHGADVRRFVY